MMNMAPHTTNYTDTLILPAEDCTVVARVPDRPGSIAALSYARLWGRPYAETSDDLLSRVAAERKSVAGADFPAFRAAFFSKGQPCLRASPLTKTHGWAIHADSEGRIALLDPDGPEAARLKAGAALTVHRAMRNRRG